MHVRDLVPPGQLAHFCRERKIIELALFGSVARGELRPDSDLDLLVRFDESARVSLLDFAHIQGELTDLFGREVDLVERDAVVNPFMRRTILRDATVLYAA
jgi:predicted nucleotidyltransferase